MKRLWVIGALVAGCLSGWAQERPGGGGGGGTNGVTSLTGDVTGTASGTTIPTVLSSTVSGTHTFSGANTLTNPANIFGGNGAYLTNGVYKSILRDFGALGGSHDDTAAFQAAANCRYPVVIEKSTNYSINTVYLTNLTTFISQGARINFLGGGNGWALYGNTNITNITIAGLDLEGGGAGTIPTMAGGGGGLWLPSSSTNSIIENNVFSGFSFAGMEVPGSETYTVTFDNPVITIAKNTFQYNWIGLDFQSLTGTGSEAGDAEYVHPVDNDFYNNANGCYIAAGNIFVTGGRATDNGIGFNIEPAENAAHGTVANCTINHNSTNVYGTSFNNGFSFVNDNFEGGGYEVMHNTVGVTFQDCVLSGDGIIADGSTNFVVWNKTFAGLPPITLTNGGLVILEGNYDTFSTTNIVPMGFSHLFSNTNHFTGPVTIDNLVGITGNGAGLTNVPATSVAAPAPTWMTNMVDQEITNKTLPGADFLAATNAMGWGTFSYTNAGGYSMGWTNGAFSVSGAVTASSFAGNGASLTSLTFANITLPSVGGNLFLASPSGSSGTGTFRAITTLDLVNDAIYATNITSDGAGNFDLLSTNVDSTSKFLRWSRIGSAGLLRNPTTGYVQYQWTPVATDVFDPNGGYDFHSQSNYTMLEHTNYSIAGNYIFGSTNVLTAANVTAGANITVTTTAGNLVIASTASGGGSSNITDLAYAALARNLDVATNLNANAILVTNSFNQIPAASTGTSTIATDASKGNYFRFTATANFTLANPSNPTDGQKLTWEILQDGTGNRVLTPDTQFAFGYDLTGILLTTNANKRDFITAIYNSGQTKWYVTGIVRGY